jgi:hypothetical protein
MIVSKSNLSIPAAHNLLDNWIQALSETFGMYGSDEQYGAHSNEGEYDTIWLPLLKNFYRYIDCSDYHGPGWQLWKTLVSRKEFPPVDIRVFVHFDNDVEAVQFRLATS